MVSFSEITGPTDQDWLGPSHQAHKVSRPRPPVPRNTVDSNGNQVTAATGRTWESAIRQYPLLLPPHLRTLRSGIPRIRGLDSTELTVSLRQLARVRGMAAITATSTSSTDSSVSPDVRPFPATIRSRPVLRPC